MKKFPILSYVFIDQYGFSTTFYYLGLCFEVEIKLIYFFKLLQFTFQRRKVGISWFTFTVLWIFFECRAWLKLTAIPVETYLSKKQSACWGEIVVKNLLFYYLKNDWVVKVKSMKTLQVWPESPSRWFVQYGCDSVLKAS